MAQIIDKEDDIESFENKNTARKLPIAFLIFFFGMIAWGIYYFFAYTPQISGWSSDKELHESLGDTKK